ncbi:MAG: hypothetical protein KY445_03475, partial [Armatimonadetes bacterium]|nr:hypothetical protein [Armatimonadota bacterium]
PSGPSAKSAARLKKRPTSKWLAHYLPDDRYKIAGGVWKYVSTDLDTYYHRPDSPLMMRQSASRVIGFASAAEALEAGYKPAPGLNSYSSGATGAMGTSAMARSSRARRVVLADGLSSVILPAGWRTLPGTTQRAQYGLMTRDQLLGPKGQRLVFETMVFSGPNAASVDLGRFVNVKFFKSMKTGMNRFSNNLNSSSIVNSQISGQNTTNAINQFQNINFFPVKVNGRTGVGATMKAAVAGQPTRFYLFGQAQKMWVMSDFAGGRGSSLGVLKSLRLR